MACVLEWAARALNPFGFVRSDSPALVFELRPGWRGEHNADGRRDRSRARAKPAGVFRVIGVGDSNTYGHGVLAEQTFLAVAERLLAARTPGVEVLNFGVPGYNTAMEAALLEQSVPEWSPDLAVVQFCANDYNLPNFVWTRRRGPIAHSYAIHQLFWPLAERWPAFWKRGVMGYRYDGDVFPLPGLEHVPIENYNTIGDPARAPAEYHYMLGGEGVRAALARIAALGRRRGLPVILLLGWGGHDGEVAAWGRAEGLEVLDEWPAIQAHLAARGRRFESLWVKPPTDAHPNAEAHAILGELLAAAVAAHLPSAP
jgi:lysophospholipase L1-like esterase